jgi:hypothetical protein
MKASGLPSVYEALSYTGLDSSDPEKIIKYINYLRK